MFPTDTTSASTFTRSKFAHLPSTRTGCLFAFFFICRDDEEMLPFMKNWFHEATFRTLFHHIGASDVTQRRALRAAGAAGSLLFVVVVLGSMFTWFCSRAGPWSPSGRRCTDASEPWNLIFGATLNSLNSKLNWCMWLCHVYFSIFRLLKWIKT